MILNSANLLGLQSLEGEKEVNYQDDPSNEGNHTKSKILGNMGPIIWPHHPIAERQGPSCYHKDPSNHGRHRVKQDRGLVAQQRGDKEDQQRDGEEHAGAQA